MSLSRWTRRLTSFVMLAGLLASQPAAICASLCLVRGHARVAHSMPMPHQGMDMHVGQACHSGTVGGHTAIPLPVPGVMLPASAPAVPGGRIRVARAPVVFPAFLTRLPPPADSPPPRLA
ncbi:MAG: hypothetical protein AB7I33_11615 [Gemmatimonadales bacterium]